MIASLVLFVLFAITVGFAGFRGYGGVGGGIAAILYLLFVYFFGPAAVLKFKKFKSLNILEKLSEEIRHFEPKLYILDSSKIVVFSLPPKKICISRGVLEKLNKAELESIILREIIKIKTGETLKEFFLKTVSGPLSVLFYQENKAKLDFETVKETGDPQTLATALEKLYGAGGSSLMRQ